MSVGGLYIFDYPDVEIESKIKNCQRMLLHIACLKYAENRKNRVFEVSVWPKNSSCRKNRRHFRHLHEKLGILKKKIAPKTNFLTDFENYYVTSELPTIIWIQCSSLINFICSNLIFSYRYVPSSLSEECRCEITTRHVFPYGSLERTNKKPLEENESGQTAFG